MRLQAGVVALLFLGSIAVVAYHAVRARAVARGEPAVQSWMRAASERMAAEAAREAIPPLAGPREKEETGRRLRGIADRVLREYPGAEGGFYVAEGPGVFIGYAYPTGDEMPATISKSTSPAAAGASVRGDDPPPREMPFVRLQAEHTLAGDGDGVQFDVRTVGPSRVAILTRAVGDERPARAAVWILYRLSKPDDLAAEVWRYRASTGMALAGIVIALGLTANLGRSLRRQRLEQERLRDELRRAEHLAGLGKLLAGVAHEVRNPLAAIRSTVQLWQRLPETARDAESLKGVVGAVDRLNDVVTRMLQFSRAENAASERVDVNRALGETLDLIAAQAAERGVRVERNFATSLPPVRGAAGGLAQVFLNLCGNALQAMPGGGVLTVSSGHDVKAKQIVLRFADTGDGVSAEDRAHLFEPFFTTRADGAGLGLAICREIVTRHGGDIRLLPTGERGATFEVRLPAAGGEA